MRPKVLRKDHLGQVKYDVVDGFESLMRLVQM